MLIPQIRLLTGKLRGRTEAPDQSRGCTLSSSTRGDTTELHGPLQRLLELAALHRELKAIAVRVKNNALIIIVTSATRSVFDSKPGLAQSDRKFVYAVFGTHRQREVSQAHAVSAGLMP